MNADNRQLGLFAAPPAPVPPPLTPRQTKRASWHAVQDDGRLGHRQQQVLDAISHHGPITDRASGRLLGWPINRVVPRRHELVAAGLVVQDGTLLDVDTNRRVAAWTAA